MAHFAPARFWAGRADQRGFEDDGAQDVSPAMRKFLDAFRERKVEEVHQAITRDTRHRTGDGPAESTMPIDGSV